MKTKSQFKNFLIAMVAFFVWLIFLGIGCILPNYINLFFIVLSTIGLVLLIVFMDGGE